MICEGEPSVKLHDKNVEVMTSANGNTRQDQVTIGLVDTPGSTNHLVTLCLMVWDWRVSRAAPMLSCWHDLLFLFVSYCFIFFFLPWLVVWGWPLWTDRVFSLSLGLAQRTPINNNKALVLFGFSIMHQWLHHSRILAKCLLKKGATAGLSAGFQTTASNVESVPHKLKHFTGIKEELKRTQHPIQLR